MNNASNELDPTKHHLQIFLYIVGIEQPHPFMAVYPRDSAREVKDLFNRFRTNADFAVASVHFLPPGEPLKPHAFGGAETPLNPNKWHMHIEYLERLPNNLDGIVPTLVISPHNTYEYADGNFKAYCHAVISRGGRMIYAAILPPASSKQQPIVMIARPGS